jgi:hypothetical protein
VAEALQGEPFRVNPTMTNRKKVVRPCLNISPTKEKPSLFGRAFADWTFLRL